MDNQTLMNTIATLSGTLDPLMRANQSDTAKVVADKILELVKTIK